MNNDLLTGLLIGGAAKAKAEKEKARALEKKALLDNGYYEDYKRMIDEDAENVKKEIKQAFWLIFGFALFAIAISTITFVAL